MIIDDMEEWWAEIGGNEPQPATDDELMEAVTAWAIAWQVKEDNYKAEEEAFYTLADVANRWAGSNR